LIVIDIQNDYFPGGKMEVEGSVEAGLQAASAISAFRGKKLSIIHVQHFSVRPGPSFLLPDTDGAEIHESVKPLPSEKVILKHYPNSFRDTELRTVLDEAETKHLVVCGMMSHMCIDSTVRSAFDQGFRVTVLSNACATRALRFGDVDVSARLVHAASMAALGAVFARVTSAEQYLSELRCD
ncbi:MAG: cysteine hydrolase family protein, partial [Pseudomonadota bacterium]